jgi:hypothetical protein
MTKAKLLFHPYNKVKQPKNNGRLIYNPKKKVSKDKETLVEAVLRGLEKREQLK